MSSMEGVMDWISRHCILTCGVECCHSLSPQFAHVYEEETGLGYLCLRVFMIPNSEIGINSHLIWKERHVSKDFRYACYFQRKIPLEELYMITFTWKCPVFPKSHQAGAYS